MPVALVTGCSSGFGLLTALHLARHGHTVAATMRDPDRGGELVEARDREGLPIDVFRLDVTDDRSVTSAVQAVVERRGPVDLLVNNAGIGFHGAVEEVGDADARALFETNVFGVLRVTRAVLPAMRERGSGVIVNVSSIAGRVSAPFGGLYAATKYALEALSESLHYELGPFGVRVALIEPGGFPTRFDANRRAVADASSPYADLRQRWEKAYDALPGRDQPADPMAVAEAIHQAATDPEFPLRRLVGADAELIGGLRRDLDDASFEHTVRAALDFWDGARHR